MLKTFKYRLYPDTVQQQLLSKTFGCCRFVYNRCLDFKNKRYAAHKQSVSRYELSAMLTFLKKTEEFSFLNEVNSQSLQSELVHLDKAYTNFFQHHAAFPKFKSKYDRQSFACPQRVAVDFKSQSLSIPKFPGIKTIFHRQFTGKIKTCTISKNAANKYYVSILVDDGMELPKSKAVKDQTAIGLDVGLKSFVVTSAGDVVDNPKFYRNAESRIKVLQRRVSRKVKGSANCRKAKLRLAKKHDKVASQRSNFLHQVSSRLVKNHDTIFVEDLNVKGMIKNRCLAKSISDASWSEFFRQLKYKSEWYGKNLLEIGRFEPSSKMCSCGVVNHKLTLTDRCWTCGSCGIIHDRDLLAAQNIKKFGLLGLTYRTRTERSGEPVELSALAEAVKQESLASDGRSLCLKANVVHEVTRESLIAEMKQAMDAGEPLIGRITKVHLPKQQDSEIVR